MIVKFSNFCYNNNAMKNRKHYYVSIKNVDGELFWGVGINRDIIVSSVKALVSAVNRLIEKRYK